MPCLASRGAGTIKGFGFAGASVPDAPTGVSASGSNGQAMVFFTPPTNTGGLSITGYTVTSSGGQTATGTNSPITVTGLTNGNSYTFTVKATNSIGNSAPSSSSSSINVVLINAAGQQAYTTAGTYTWVAPVGVTSVSAVAVGGGAPGTRGGGYGYGGGGGGLGWKNNISVVPGQSYTVEVDRTDNNGGCSYFISLSVCVGYGGDNLTGGSYVGDGGGNGGNGASGNPTLWEGSGGGAGGYSGNGGAGGYPTNYDGNGGGGAGGKMNGGGGVGILGQGASGTTTSKGGSGGSTGSGQVGGTYGGGAGVDYAQGGGGAVRIIWGAARAFPSSNTADVAVLTLPDAPTGLSTTAGDGQITVSFTAPTNTGGLPITSYTVTSSPGNIAATSTGTSITVTGLTNGTSYTFTATATNAVGTSSASSASSAATPVASGSAQYTSPGTYTWVAPTGVTSVSAVTIAAGSAGGSVSDGDTYSGSGGAGGALRYKNNISVTPGTSYTVTVGSNGQASTFSAVSSYDVTNYGGPGGSGSPNYGSTTLGGGGGGAGGYSGSGGAGGNGRYDTGQTDKIYVGTAGSGGGGGGGASGAGGGGVGIWGAGGNGAAGTYYIGSGSGTQAGGGSSGSSASGKSAGSYGGGGAGGDMNYTSVWGQGQPGASGAVRIIWGTNRSFPNNAA